MSEDPYRSPEECEVLPPGAYRNKEGISVGGSKLWGDRTAEEAWEHWSWASGISRTRYEEMVAAEVEVLRLEKELDALMSPGVIEGMRRACLLRKDATAEEVLAHLKLVADSYEDVGKEYHMTKEQSAAVDRALFNSVEESDFLSADLRKTARRRLEEADRKMKRAMELLSDEQHPDEELLRKLGKLRYEIQGHAAGLEGDG